jgi:hypothetical protein
MGSLELNSLVICFRNLGVTWPHDLDGTTIVKIRFERDHAFELPLEVRGVSTRGWEQIP